MHTILNNPDYARHIQEKSRIINNLFTFTGIGVTGGFEHFSTGGLSGPPAVAITGQTYHLIRNTEYADHSIHWFLYDEQLLQNKAIDCGAHTTIVQAITDDLHDINPYIHQLQHF